MTEWLKVLGDFVVLHGKGLFEKRRRVWATLLIAISTGIMQKVNSIELESTMMTYVQITFIISVVALILWAIEYTWLEINSARKIKKEMKEKAKRIRETVEELTPYELEFLTNFNEKSKRAKIDFQEDKEVYSSLNKLGIIELIDTCSANIAHAKFSDEYKGQYGYIRERHLKRIKDEELFWESLGSEEEK